jgi:hypothetical protein
MPEHQGRKIFVAGILAAFALGCSQLPGLIPSGGSGSAGNLLDAGQIAQVDLASIVWQSGDLPAAYGHGTPTATVPDRFKDFPPAQAQISVELTAGGSSAGNATVFLYAAAADIEKAFNPKGEPYDESKALAGLGEKSSALEFSIPYGTGADSIDGVNVFWTRCSAVAEIRLITSAPDDAKAYARALDARLAAAACAGGAAPAAAAAADEPAAESAAAPTDTVKPAPATDCPYRADTDLATLTNLIHAEATAANTKDMSIIRKIFAPNAVLRFRGGEQVWNEPFSHYTELFETATVRNSKHFGIAPTGQGITDQKAWMISGSSGTYIPNGGEPVEYYNEPGKDTWVMTKNFYGCWVITEFGFY